MTARGSTIGQRFLAKVVKTPVCWLWVGAKGNGGYGVFSYESTTTTAHRWSYLYHVGPIPADWHVDHLCRVPACVNPAHLQAVTAAENKARSLRAQRIILGRRASIDLSWPGFVVEFGGESRRAAA